MSAAPQAIASAEQPIMFEDDGRAHFKASGFWCFQVDPSSGWMPGEWLRVTDPRDGAKRDAWWLAGRFTSKVTEGTTTA